MDTNEILVEDYWKSLQDIQSSIIMQSKSVAVIAKDAEGNIIRDSGGNVTYTLPPFIDIDLVSREILIEDSDYSDFLSVSTDHRAETVYFRCDRYFEDVDLSRLTTVIEYINAAGEARLYPVTLKDTRSERGKLLFGWCLGAEATKMKGEIKFAIHFYSVSTTDNDIRLLYSLHTIPTTGNIMYGIADMASDTTESYDETYNYSASVIEAIYDELNTLKSQAVSWIDV